MTEEERDAGEGGAGGGVHGEVGEMRGERLGVRYVRVGDVRRWVRNPKLHDLEAVKESVRRYGFRDAPIWDETLGAVTAGNGRVEALVEMERDGEEVPRGILVEERGGAWCMPLQVGVDAKSTALAEAFALDHNNLVLAGSSMTAVEAAALWDDGYFDVLQDLKRSGTMAVSVDDEDMAAILRAKGGPFMLPPPPEPGPSPADELLEKWGVEPGDLWTAGPHRILCADARLSETWTRLMGDKSAEWVWMDPPYGVDYKGKTSFALTIEGDEPEDLEGLLDSVYAQVTLHAMPGCPVYACTPAMSGTLTFMQAFIDAGWKFHATLVWVKDRMVLGHGDYHFQHESIFYGWTPGARAPWFGGRDKVSVFHVPNPRRSEVHPTMKPPELIMAHLQNSSEPGGLGVDPFVGSGSTLVAAHLLDRLCYAIDIEPKYVAVSLERLKDMGLDVQRSAE